jgi:hypothetical protein
VEKKKEGFLTLYKRRAAEKKNGSHRREKNKEK